MLSQAQWHLFSLISNISSTGQSASCYQNMTLENDSLRYKYYSVTRKLQWAYFNKIDRAKLEVLSHWILLPQTNAYGMDLRTEAQRLCYMRRVLGFFPKLHKRLHHL